MGDDKKKFSKLVLAERDNQELEMKVQEFLSDKVIVDESEYEALKDEIRRHEEVFQFSANKIAALKRENEHLAKVIDNVWTALNEAGTTVQGARGQMLADALLTAEEQE